MGKVLIIRSKKGSLYANMIRSYLAKKGLGSYLTTWEKDQLRQNIKKYGLTPKNTLIHARTAGRHVNDNLVWLESLGFKILNTSGALRLTSNKYLAQVVAKKNGIPVTPSYNIAKGDLVRLKKLLKKNKNLILKPIYSRGRGKFCQKIELGDSLKIIKEKFESVPGNYVLVQKFVNYKKLIRAIVIDDKVLKEAFTYDVPVDSWKCSVCMNPNVKRYKDTRGNLSALALKTAKAFGSKIGFIDFFETKDGKFIFNEVNTACSLRYHETVTSVPIHEYIGNFLIKSLNERPILVQQ